MGPHAPTVCLSRALICIGCVCLVTKKIPHNNKDKNVSSIDRFVSKIDQMFSVCKHFPFKAEWRDCLRRIRRPDIFFYFLHTSVRRAISPSLVELHRNRGEVWGLLWQEKKKILPWDLQRGSFPKLIKPHSALNYSYCTSGLKELREGLGLVLPVYSLILM